MVGSLGGSGPRVGSLSSRRIPAWQGPEGRIPQQRSQHLGPLLMTQESDDGFSLNSHETQGSSSGGASCQGLGEIVDTVYPLKIKVCAGCRHGLGLSWSYLLEA